MKKFFALLMLVVALGGFSLGCSGASAPQSEEAPAPAETGTDTAPEAGDAAEAPAEG